MRWALVAAFLALLRPAAAVADAVDDVRWYRQQPASLLELGIREVCLWVQENEQVRAFEEADSFVFVEDPDGPIVIELFTARFGNYSEDACASGVFALRNALLPFAETEEEIIRSYAVLFYPYVDDLEISATFDRYQN